MARNKYYKYEFDGVYKCGHEGTIKQGGFTKDYAKWQAEQEFKSHICPECTKEEKYKVYKQEAEEINKEAKEMGLPELEGTEKQVTWALSLRPEFKETLEKNLVDLPKKWLEKFKEDYPQDYNTEDGAEEIKNVIQSAIDYIINTETKSTYYIDHRNLSFLSLDGLYGIIRMQLPKNRKEEN